MYLYIYIRYSQWKHKFLLIQFAIIFSTIFSTINDKLNND